MTLLEALREADTHMRLRPGDLIRVWRPGSGWIPGYYHVGVYSDHGCVVHVSGPTGDKTGDIRLHRTDLDTFLNGGKLEIVDVQTPFTRKQIIQRAEALVGQRFDYSIPVRTCETFAYFVVTGKAKSPQLTSAVLKVIGAGAALSLAFGAGLAVAGVFRTPKRKRGRAG